MCVPVSVRECEFVFPYVHVCVCKSAYVSMCLYFVTCIRGWVFYVCLSPCTVYIYMCVPMNDYTQTTLPQNIFPYFLLVDKRD